MSDQYTLFAYDINTNAKLTEIPFKGLMFNQTLNGAGGISFSIPLGGDGVAPLAKPLLDYQGRPVKAYVDRDGVIIGGAFVIWVGTYQNDTSTLSCGGSEIRSLLEHRVQLRDYSITTYPAGIAPGLLLYTVLNDTQTLGGPGSSLGLSIVNNSAGMPNVVPGYPISQNTMVDQIIRDMTQISVPGVGGVDVSVSSAWAPTTGVPADILTISTPRVGSPAGLSGVIFDLSTVLDFTWPTDGKSAATTLIVTGSGSGSAMPIATVNAPGIPVGGLGQSPRLDRVESTTAQSQAQVNLMANGLAAQYAGALITPTITVATNLDGQPLGSWAVGDDARIVCPPDVIPRFPNGIDQYWRIVGQSVVVPDEGVSTVTITLNIPPIY